MTQALNVVPFASYGALGSNVFGSNPARFFTDFPSLNGISITSPTAGSAGNLNGVLLAQQPEQQRFSEKENKYKNLQGFLSDPNVKNLPEGALQYLLGNPSLFGDNQFNFENMIRQQGANQKETTEMLIEARKAEAERANEMGRENFKMANEARRKNYILDSLLQMPGQIADTLVKASTAHLPYQQEARQMMANTGVNLQAGYSNLANLNTQFGNQVTNLFSNAASYRPTIAGLAGKYFE